MSEKDGNESWSEMRTLGREGPESRPDGEWEPDELWVERHGEAETMERPDGSAVPETGIVDDGRTDVARRWRAGEVILGRYVVEGELGQGGMGVVYGCMDKVGGVRVAVKCLPPELGHNSVEMEEVRENFGLVCGLAHPNIAVVRQLERDGKGEYYLVMELAEGDSLRRWLRRKWKAGGVSLAEAVAVLRQVASALDYAHGMKVVHRDVKPGNVMIDGNGRVKVLDFGLAAQIRTSLSRASHAYRGTSGTGPYMAPEQWRAQPQDAKTDQYALGVMAYEMLAGRLPFENPELAVLKDAVLNGEVAAIPGVPEGAMGALRRAMAKRAEERFGSCGEFVEVLEGQGMAGGAGGRRSVRGRSLMGWVVALAVLVGAIGGGVWWKGRGRGEETAGGTPAPPVVAQPTPEEEAVRLTKEEAARQKEEGETALLAQETVARAKQEKEAAQAARKDALKARNRADRLAFLAIETLKAWGEMEAVTLQGVLGEKHPEVRKLKQRLQELTVQMEALQDGVDGESGGASGEGWIVLAEKSEKACRDDDAKVKAILDEGVLGATHPEMIGSVAANANLKMVRDVLADGLETYRRGAGELEEAERLFRDGDCNQAEERFKMAQGAFGTALKILQSRMKSAADDQQEGNAGIQAWYRKLAEQGNAFAQNNLGAMYDSGGNGNRNDAEAVEWYRKAADQGLAIAQFHLGGMYQRGLGVKQSDTEAATWFHKAAEQGNARGQCELGYMCAHGHGVVQSYAEALKWYRKSAEQGDAMAQFNLGIMYQNGHGVAKNETEAVKWFRLSAEQGNARGQVNLGWMYEKGCGVAQNFAEAAKWYRKAAEQGNAIAQENLGRLYVSGQGVDQNDVEAVKWFMVSAEQGNAYAQFGLGSMYVEGRGVPQSDFEAVKWFRLSAEQGNASAQNNLGSLYEQGRGVVKSDVDAAKWYRKAADQGNASAQNNLGSLYEQGRGVVKSDLEAIKWYREAADQGNANAQSNLGSMYANGRGVVQSYAEALKWYRKSADQGNAFAQYNLGFMYENGCGVQRNIQEAVKWYQKSAAQGNEHAQKALRSLGR